MKTEPRPTRYLSATKRAFLKFNKKCPETNTPLGAKIISCGIIRPHRPNIKLFQPLIKNVKISRGRSKYADYIDEDVVLLGHAELHFGHFLADSLSRAWTAMDSKYKNKTFAVAAHAPLAAFAAEFYKLMGIKKLLVITKRTTFRNLIIPESSFDYIKNIANKKYADTFNKIGETVAPAGFDKIYLSRTKFYKNPVIGEKRIERIFAQNGYEIIYPETLPLRQQIALVKGATHIAGVQGTALHLSLFARDGANLICLHRNNSILTMQILIDKLKNLKSAYIDCSIDPYSKRKNTCPACIIGITENLARFFDDNGFKWKDDPASAQKEMREFEEIWKQQHRIVPKWIVSVLCAVLPSREMRRALRKKACVKF
ncbi:MAG: glycosyltransferase family 61 protein [Alphaproteobacteria bacterium]|nr:glycosyltransferase family 61 protein [Alphaproteobacteria bacterium]